MLDGVGADHGDAASADVDEVFGGGASGLDVLHRHVVGRAPEDALAEQDQREVHVEKVDILLAQPLGTEQDAVGEPESLAGQRREFAFAGRAGLVDDDPHAVHFGRPDDRVGEFGEVVLAKFRDRQTDDPGLAGTQATSGEVRAVVELRDRGEHALAGRRTHVRVVIDDVGHRLDRDAGDAGDVMRASTPSQPPFATP